MEDHEDQISLNLDGEPDGSESPLHRMLREKRIPYEDYSAPIENGQVIAETVLRRLRFSEEEIAIALERTPAETQKRRRKFGRQIVHRGK